MRKREIIKIDDREITIKEMTIKEIMGILNNFTQMKQTNLDGFRSQVNEILPLVTDIDLEDILKMAPSEAKLVYEKIKEVNSVFFEIAESLGMIKVLGDLKASIVSDFSSLLVGSLKPGT